MSNPYEVLGVSENSSTDDIKRAYRELAKKYHPDQYENNPLRELAESKMREINEAYDYLMKNHNNGYKNNTYNNSNNYTNNSYGSNAYSDNMAYQYIRMDIQNNNLREAEAKLNKIMNRDAQWHYLMGVLYMKKGWYDQGLTHLTNAYNLEPNNPEYRDAYNQLQRMNNSYRQSYRTRNDSDKDMCKICAGLYCADCLCECCGGDLISCC